MIGRRFANRLRAFVSRGGPVGLAAALLLVLAGAVPSARADGDPASDLLISQNLFVGFDSGISVRQQQQLADLLRSAPSSGFPIRVAIIATRNDLGAVTGLWHRPESYARFLGTELSFAYKQRLLVVMPNGFGFNWPGHSTESAYRLLAGVPISPGGYGLVQAGAAAVKQLAAAAGIKLVAARGASSQAAPTPCCRSAPASPHSTTGPRTTTGPATRASKPADAKPAPTASHSLWFRALALIALVAGCAAIVWLWLGAPLPRRSRRSSR
jgi:hypothetical protein